MTSFRAIRIVALPFVSLVLCAAALVASSSRAAAEDPPEAPAAPAQAPAAPTGNQAPGSRISPREAMQRMSFLVGEWDGNGWVVTPDGQRHELRQHESVRTKLEGAALLIEGTGTEQGRIAFRAIGLVFYEPWSGQYRMHSGTTDGLSGVATLTPVENGFDWAPDAAKDRIRYSMRLEDGWWHETGEMSTDGGATWTPMMEMKLWKK
ncbi:MAG: hypothetical protein QUU85_05585 [Candidatus Eisenbacteria bacterium]|nr:hypothetical protein [Candidatus Eisenbacteria bacterium]